MDLKMAWQGNKSFSGKTGSGIDLVTDGIPEIGGENRGATPMEMLLGATIGCSGIDILSILEKMRLTPTHFDIEAKAERAQSHPRRFTEIKMHYTIDGEIPEDKVVRSIELSLNKYCSVAYTLNATISASYTLNGGERKQMDLT